MNSFCPEEHELIYQPLYWIAVVLCLISSLVSYGFMLITLRNYLPRVYWHRNIKILLFFNIFISFVIATLCIINFVAFLYKIITFTDACDVIVRLKNCQPIRWGFLMAFSMITLTHIAIVIERLWATCCISKYEQSSAALGIFLLIIATAISAAVVYLIMLAEDYEELVPHCLSLSATRIGTGMYYCFFGQCIAEVLVFLAQAYLQRYNKKRRQNTNLSGKYQVGENQDVLAQMNPLIVTCSVAIGGYNVIALIIRIFKDQFPKNTYIIIVFYIFIIPHLPLILNFITYRMIKKHIGEREMKTRRSIESSKNTQFSNDHFRWNEAYSIKYPTPTTKKMFWSKGRVAPAH